jgi:hypothetical protein
MELVLDADPEDLQVWLQEAEEQLQVLDESIIRLEKESDDEELLQGIFRAAHTLKGSSGSIKHTIDLPPRVVPLAMLVPRRPAPAYCPLRLEG